MNPNALSHALWRTGRLLMDERSRLAREDGSGGLNEASMVGDGLGEGRGAVQVSLAGAKN
jgi:hypothetical protein